MKTIDVFKVGGKVLSNNQLLTTFLEEAKLCKNPMVIVHGGGNKASEVMNSMGIKPQMIEGRRITDHRALEIVTMVYSGLINKNLVASLQSNGVNALGLSGADMNIINSHKRKVQSIDYGFVGDIDEVNGKSLYQLCNQGYVPVICPITHDKKGQLLNTNADTIAAQVSIALSEFAEVSLKYCFELKGVLEDFENKESVIPILSKSDMNAMYEAGKINDGMIPKLKNGFDALEGGVFKVSINHIGDLHSDQSGTMLSK